MVPASNSNTNLPLTITFCYYQVKTYDGTNYMFARFDQMEASLECYVACGCIVICIGKYVCPCV